MKKKRRDAAATLLGSTLPYRDLGAIEAGEGAHGPGHIRPRSRRQSLEDFAMTGFPIIDGLVLVLGDRRCSDQSGNNPKLRRSPGQGGKMYRQEKTCVKWGNHNVATEWMVGVPGSRSEFGRDTGTFIDAAG